MALLPNFPKGLGPREVVTFNEELKSIFHQERSLLNDPLVDFHQYAFCREDLGSGNIRPRRELVKQYTAIPASVPNLDDEQIANSGGLILPTDRFLSVYDVNPNILSVVTWPSGSGNLFTIKRKEYNPASGRCEMLIRQDNHLKGVVYTRIKAQTFAGPSWQVTDDVEKIVLTVNKSDVDMEAELIFSGIIAVGDVVFWALKEEFKLLDETEFRPTMEDRILDTDHTGADQEFIVVGVRFDPREDFYRLLCRRYGEN